MLQATAEYDPPPDWDRTQATLQFNESRGGYAFGLSDDEFSDQIAREYPALKDTTYLDFAASPPPPFATLDRLSSEIARSLFTNPHSSPATLERVDQVRARVLEELFGLKTASQRAEWDLVWTAGTTASLKLVGEAFDWSADGACYTYFKEAHTSLVGIRGCALATGARVARVARVEVVQAEECERIEGRGAETLFGIPAQCGATGARLGLGFIQSVKEKNPGSLVILDAAGYLASSVLDLGSVPISLAPDYVACSFYKVFGYPTGLGALIVKRSSAHYLSQKSYFGGGAVSNLSLSAPFLTLPRDGVTSLASLPSIHPSFEDGTLPYLNIIALDCALDTHTKLYKSHQHVTRHTASLRQFASSQLSLLRHANGTPVVRQYLSFAGIKDQQTPGPVIGFSLLDASGSYIGHAEFNRMALLNGFQLRCGGLCHMGVVASAVGLSDEDLGAAYARGKRCGDDTEFVERTDETRIPLGIARISFGAASTLSNVLDFLQFLRRYFVVSSEVISLLRPYLHSTPPTPCAQLETITLYPIKSCGGMEVPEWEVTFSGLAFDREWTLLDASTGNALSQKRYPRMALIRPVVDLSRDLLRVTAVGSGLDELLLPLESPIGSVSEQVDARICGDLVKVCPVDSKIDEWFTQFLGVPCVLSRFSSTGVRHGHFPQSSSSVVPIRLSNESPFLLITTPSLDQINDSIASSLPFPRGATTPFKFPPPIPPSAFRANFLLSPLPPSSSESPSPSALTPFIEDTFHLLQIGSITFHSLGPCRRCLMVCVNQEEGTKNRENEPFNCLARIRRCKGSGRIEFGVHLGVREMHQGGGRGKVRRGDKVNLVMMPREGG